MRAITFVAPVFVLVTACGGANRHVTTAAQDTRRPPAVANAPTIPPAPVPEPAPNAEEHNHYHGTPATRIATAAPVAVIDMTTWRARWPAAARDLAEWQKKYPDADAKMRDWDAKGDRFEAFVEWAISHPYESFNAFLLTRTGWVKDEELLSDAKHRPAVDAFLEVVRRSSDASLELVKHPNGFAWLEAHPEAQPDTRTEETRLAEKPR